MPLRARARIVLVLPVSRRRADRKSEETGRVGARELALPATALIGAMLAGALVVGKSRSAGRSRSRS